VHIVFDDTVDDKNFSYPVAGPMLCDTVTQKYECVGNINVSLSKWLSMHRLIAKGNPMNTHAPMQKNKTTGHSAEALSNKATQTKVEGAPLNNLSKTSALHQFQTMTNNSQRVAQLHALKDALNQKSRMFTREPRYAIAQLADAGERYSAQPITAPNNTGLPPRLKSGIESLSGMSMDHVKVHFNSAKPAQLNAHAYAQGSDIHVAPGQERHLPHEAWHVVQQQQGRVQPTMQLKDGMSINDNQGLEREADVMGAKAMALFGNN